MAVIKPKALPKSMGACADLLFTTRNARLLVGKQLEALMAEEQRIKEHIINNMSKLDTGASGKLARVSVTRKKVPQVQDWDKFYAYVKKTGSFDLMQKRLADNAIKERWDAGKIVPGVGTFDAVGISLNKV